MNVSNFTEPTQALVLFKPEKESGIIFLDNAQALKSEAIALADAVQVVENEEQNLQAIEAQKVLVRLIKQVEGGIDPLIKRANAYKNKVWFAQKQFQADLDAELIRVAALAGSYAQLKLAQVRAAEQARLAQERLMEQERVHKEQEVLEATRIEKQRLDVAAKEAAAKAAAAKSAKAKAEAAEMQLEVQRQQQLATAKSHDELDRINGEHADKVAALPVTVFEKTKGQTVKTDYDIVVSDIHLLYRHYPACVHLEPLIGQIKLLVNEGTVPKGVIATPIVKASVRLGKERSAIDV